jgi:murein DD-endopeptidase MepM/ murein hydrolase activator NlpD
MVFAASSYMAGGRLVARSYRGHEFAQVASVRAQIASLTESINKLNDENAALRIAVGLAPLPSDVYKVGIGGRAAPWPEAVTPELDTWDRLDRLSRGVRLLKGSYRQVESRIRENEETLSRVPSITPVPGAVVNSRFGVRLHPIFGVKAMHEGMDFAAETGSPVLATADGVVTFAGKYGGYGNMIEIDHQNGLMTRYAHNHANHVQVGQRVTRGQVIGLVGATGITTSTHLHYEVRRDGVAIDPQPYVLPGVIVE